MTLALDPRSFLATLVGATQAASAGDSANRPVRLATVDPAYLDGSGPPRVTFDGEGTLSSKRYAYVDSYRPAAGDRVVLIPSGTTYLIGGKIDDSSDVPVRSANLFVIKGVCSTSVVTSSTTQIDLTGATTTFSTAHPNAIVMLSATWDIQINTASPTRLANGYLVVDGTTQDAIATLDAFATKRETVAENYDCVLPGPGNHTVKMQVAVSNSTVNASYRPLHSRFTGLVLDFF